MELIKIPSWKDYELIDSGGFEKLERFGKYILCRPEPQAIWNKTLSEKDWEQLWHARYLVEKGSQPVINAERGRWVTKKDMPEQWIIAYPTAQWNIKFRLGLTAFRHIGVFPEQAENWEYIYNHIKPMQSARFLNLFAYTGGASLAARAAGADVYHVDSVKQTISWAKENMDLSQLSDMHWIVEDALMFARREAKRGNKYQGIILDPPAYGRGPQGEKWLLEQHLNELVHLCSQILDREKGFLILNLYSMGFSSVIAKNLLESYFSGFKMLEYGELALESSKGNMLPLGVFARVSFNRV